jgi:hypothetical protein
VEDKVITRNFDIFDTTIPVTGKESFFTENVTNNLNQAFAFFGGPNYTDTDDGYRQKKIKLALNNGGEIILEEDGGNYKTGNVVGTKFYIKVSVLERSDLNIKGFSSYINKELLNMANDLSSLDNSKKTIRLGSREFIYDEIENIIYLSMEKAISNRHSKFKT